MNKWLTHDRLSGLITLGASIALLAWIIPAGVEVHGNGSSAGLSPAFMPRLIAWLIGGLALCIVFAKPVSSPGPLALFSSNTLLTAAGFILYIILVPWIGYLVSTLVFVPACLIFFGVRKWSVVIPLSLVMPLLLYWFFSKMMYVLLPTGIFI